MTTTTETKERTRTVAWSDPMVAARAARELSGLDYLAAVGRGELPLPPFLALVGIEPVEIASGRAVFATDPAEFQYNTIGSVHGGFLATLLDSALGCAVHSMLPAGAGWTTLTLSTNFVRGVTAGTGRLTCEAAVVHGGRRVATAEARVVDADGRVYAHATTTCMIFGLEKEERA